MGCWVCLGGYWLGGWLSTGSPLFGGLLRLVWSLWRRLCSQQGIILLEGRGVIGRCLCVLSGLPLTSTRLQSRICALNVLACVFTGTLGGCPFDGRLSPRFRSLGGAVFHRTTLFSLGSGPLSRGVTGCVSDYSRSFFGRGVIVVAWLLLVRNPLVLRLVIMRKIRRLGLRKR